MQTLQTILAVASIAPDSKKPDSRYWLNSVYVTPTRMAASDGHRLILIDDDFTNYTEEGEVFIPVKAIYSLAKKLGKKGLGTTVRLQGGILAAGLEAEVVSLIDMTGVRHSFSKIDEVIAFQKNRPATTNTKFNWPYMASMQKALASIAKKDTEYFKSYSLHISDYSAVFTMGNATGLVMALM